MRRIALFPMASTLVASAVLAFAQNPAVAVYPSPDSRFKTDLLLIVAHPDDETAIASYLAKVIFDEHRRVSIVYCNRGGGGGNSIGNEQSTALGEIREIEARRAASSFGIENVWFLEGKDTPGQDLFSSLETWHHGAVLEEVVRLIRLTRAEVVVTWLPHIVAGENHGDHQASGVIATEGFDLAGDPTAFPAQVAAPRERIDINNAGEGLLPWQPKKLYFFSDASHPIDAPGPKFDMAAVSPSRSQPYYKLAAGLHTYHLTQGDVSETALKALKSGDFAEFRKWLQTYHLIFGKSVIPSRPEGDVFEDITSGPVEYVPPPGFHPASYRGITMELGGAFAFYREFWKAHGIERVGPLVGPEFAVAGGSYVHVPLLIRNATRDSVEVTLTPVLPRDWLLESAPARCTVRPFEVFPAQTFFRAPGHEGHETQNLMWRAAVRGATLDSVTVRIDLVPWALPQ